MLFSPKSNHADLSRELGLRFFDLENLDRKLMILGQ